MIIEIRTREISAGYIEIIFRFFKSLINLGITPVKVLTRFHSIRFQTESAAVQPSVASRSRKTDNRVIVVLDKLFIMEVASE